MAPALVDPASGRVPPPDHQLELLIIVPFPGVRCNHLCRVPTRCSGRSGGRASRAIAGGVLFEIVVVDLPMKIVLAVRGGLVNVPILVDNEPTVNPVDVSHLWAAAGGRERRPAAWCHGRP